MHKQIYISTGVFKEKSLKAVISKCIKYSIMNVELSSGLEYGASVMQYADYGYKNGVNYLVHNYFPPANPPFVLNLASEDDVILNVSIEHCKKAIDLCEKYASPFFSVHSGFAFHATSSQLGRKLTEVQRFSYEKAEAIFINSINILCSYALTKNISVLIENNVLAPINLIEDKNELLLGVTADDLLRISKRILYQNFGLLIDTGHLKVSANSLQFSCEKFLDNVEDLILAFHLNENDGISDSNFPIEENSWFIPLLKKYSDKIFVIESYGLSVPQILHSIKIIEKAL